MDKARFLPAGDRALVVEFGREISPETNRLVRNLYLALREAGIPGVGELVPSYRSLLVYYDPLATGIRDLERTLRELTAGLGDREWPAPRTTVLPVCYEPEYGPDLDFVAACNGLSREEVVTVHTRTAYLIYMLGFSPGFPYLHMSGRISAPRLANPRKCIPAGSVGIAGSQTGVYPVDSPGGWRIIGRTPVRLYDPDRVPPILLSAGDYVRFVPVGKEEYLAIAARATAGGTAG